MRSPAQTAMTVVAMALALSCCGGTRRVTVTSASTGCPASTPGGPPPPRRALLNFGTPMARPSDPRLYGNGVLWTVLPWSNQTIRGAGPAVRMKIPWFRARTGSVAISAAPLGGPPARFTADVGSPESYGATGFAPSILHFGRAGCWRLHAQLASHVLTLVVRVSPPPRTRPAA
jgi:hypothetical protein